MEYASNIPARGDSGYVLPYYVSFFAMFAPQKTSDEILRKINDVVRKISEDNEFQDKNKSLDLTLSYQDTASFENYISQYKTDMLVFFKEEGFVK